ncbi:hypothetical protein CAPTEDRAFT_201254 [Capitella teleta]|uniref:Uncharacterized protein n=1 Tax=Capitella teleta TaxID=283909 RepID=R7UVK1_CAPTE|nr:hypothetical protein CAPTEDRAFT_201254 [Capitella teleta]|eukprot:ELU10277.1 hypothetical protein CAPTEDRAFT_201254 [Capitella teleta]
MVNLEAGILVLEVICLHTRSSNSVAMSTPETFMQNIPAALQSDSSSDESDSDVFRGRNKFTPKNSSAARDDVRRSGRLSSRRKRTFQMPTREDVLDKIDSSVSPKSSHIKSLYSRKLVNDFTKRNSRYNHDPDLTDGESSIDDFIVGDQSCEEDEETSSMEAASDSSASESGDQNRNGIIADDSCDSVDAVTTAITPRSQLRGFKRRRLTLSLSDSDDGDSVRREPSSRAAMMAQKRESEKKKFDKCRISAPVKNRLIESDSE